MQSLNHLPADRHPIGRVWRFLLALLVLYVLPGAQPAFSQDNLTWTTIDFPNSTFSALTAISNNQRYLTGRYDDDKLPPRRHGFLFDSVTGVFKSIDATPTSIFTHANGVNSSGDVSGLFFDAQRKQHGFLMTEDGFTQVDVPDSRSTGGSKINEKGDFVGGFVDSAGKEHGYLLRKGEFTTIDFPEARRTIALGINSRRQIVGLYTDAQGDHGFLLSHGNYSSIDIPGAISTEAQSISEDGDIVGGYHDAADKVHGFILHLDGEVTTLDFPAPGVKLTFANDINPQGIVVGAYQDATGRRHGFLATPSGQNEDDEDGCVPNPDRRSRVRGRLSDAAGALGGAQAGTAAAVDQQRSPGSRRDAASSD